VAQRALILAAVNKKARAMWEGEPGDGGRMALRMCKWVETGILREELSERRKRVCLRAPGRLRDPFADSGEGPI